MLETIGQRILVFTLLLAIIPADSYIFSKANFTREWAISASHFASRNLDIFSANGRLIYRWLSGPNPKNLYVQSMEIDAQVCNVSVLHENNSMEELVGSALGNGKILFWFRDYDSAGKRQCWRQYFVQSRTCLYDAYRINDLYSDVRVGDLSIVPYHDTFDAIFRNSTLCQVNHTCVLRFNDKGTNVLNFTIPNDAESVSFMIEPTKIDESSGYFVVSDLENETSILKLLDLNYTEMRRREFNVTVSAISAAHGRLRACHVNSRGNQVRCVSFGSQLSKFVDLFINIENKIDYIDMFNLADASSIVLTRLKSDHTHLIVHHIDEYGKVSEPVKLAAYQTQEIHKIRHYQLRDEVNCINMISTNVDLIAYCITPHDNDGSLKLLYDKSL